MSDLELKNDIYGKAKNFAGPMILFSILGIYQKTVPFNQLDFNSFTGVWLILGILTAVLTLCMIHH